MLASPDLLEQWHRAVNCFPEQIEEWHTTTESSAVGTRRPGDRWSVGQLAGMRTVDLLETPVEEWAEAEWAHVRRVAGFVGRHRAQWPRGDVRDTRWRHSLRNWGHDPLWEARLALSTVDGRGHGAREVRVDSEAVGVLHLDVGVDGGVVVERLHLEEPWQRRGIGSALLHLLALQHRGEVEVVAAGAPAGLVERWDRRHLVAPTPGAPLLRLEGW